MIKKGGNDQRRKKKKKVSRIFEDTKVNSFLLLFFFACERDKKKFLFEFDRYADRRLDSVQTARREFYRRFFRSTRKKESY